MKFFSSLGSCYRPAVAHPPPEPTWEGGGDHVRPRPCSSTKRKKHSHNWRPALSVISEDGVIVSAQESEKRVEPGKKPPSKSGSPEAKDRRRGRGSRYNNGSNAYDHYYSRTKSIRLFIPAFSPTPYPF